MNDRKCESCGQKALWLSTTNNILLTLVKGGVAILTGSRALFADAVESAANSACSLFAFWGVKYGKKPSDNEYPYGYGKLEFIIGITVGIILFVVAAGVLYDAIKTLFFNTALHPPKILSFWVALLSVYSNFVVSYFTKCSAKELNSPALNSVSVSNRSDAYTSIVVVICILGSQFGLPQLDPIAACLVGLIIFKMGIQLIIENYHGLLDVSISPEIIQKMKDVLDSIREVKGISYLKTRQSGRKIFVDLQIYVEGRKTVDEANDIIREVSSSLMRRIEYLSNIHVSIKPIL